jgi:hypothetical protein
MKGNDMARPRELIEPKKTERFTLNLPETEALQLYRLCAEMGVQPAVLLRRFARLGMAASMRSHHADENESPSGFATLGNA